MPVQSFRMTGGTNLDVLAALVPPDTWTGAVSTVFRDGLATRVNGYAGVGGVLTTALPRHLVAWNHGESFLLGAAPTLVFAAGDPQAAVVNSVIESIEPSTSTHAVQTPGAWVGVAPTDAGQWTGGIMNGVPYFNHPGYQPVDFRAGTPFATLPDWNATFPGQRCIALRHFREFYVALGLGTTGIFDKDRVNWSARAAVTTTPAVWTPAAANAAGNAELSGGGDLVDALPLGNVLMLYKRRAIWTMRYVGGNYIFDFQTAVEGRGALSQNCVVAVGQNHVFLTDDDVLSWPGAGSPQSILTGKARRVLGQFSGATGWENSFLLYMPRQNEVWILSNDVTYSPKVFVVDLGTGNIGRRTLTKITHGVWVRDTPASIKTTGQMVLAFRDGAASAIAPVDGVSGTQMSVAITNSVTRDALDFGKPDLVKKVQWIRPHVDAVGGTAMNVYCAGTLGPDDAISYGSAQVFTVGTTDKVDFLTSGRYIHIKFESTSGVTWVLPGFDVGYALAGQE